MSQKIIWLAMATIISTIIGFASKAQAVGVNYQTLEAGVSQKGTTYLGDNTRNSVGWEYYNFFGSAGDRVTITAKSLNSQDDPAFGVWKGLANNTDNFSSIFDARDDDLSQIAFAYDEMTDYSSSEPNQVSFTLPTTGGYTVAVTSDNGNSDSQTLHEVPEPLTILGSLAAIGVGVFLKRKYGINSQTEDKHS